MMMMMEVQYFRLHRLPLEGKKLLSRKRRKLEVIGKHVDFSVMCYELKVLEQK